MILGLLSVTIILYATDLDHIDIDGPRYIEVEVRGEVENPGVYELELGSTYEDLFERCIVTEDGDKASYALQDVLYNRQVVVINKEKEEELISINSADVDELMKLPGIGEVMALRIIAYRKECGSFLKLEDIMNVKGIGNAKFAKIRPYICL